MNRQIPKGTGPLRSITPAIDIYIKLAQYPILADQIRVRMREELFRRGIIDQAKFEQEIKEKSLESQQREGLHDPFAEEQANTWQRRLERIRNFQTDAYFANNLGITLVEQLIQEVLRSQPSPSNSDELTFNPEIAPWELLFRQGEIYEALPPPERAKVKHHLQEIKVVLIKGMISDQLRYIGVAKKILSIADLRYIYKRRIGNGKIGGKAAGLMLAWRILQQQDPEVGADISQSVGIPESYFIGSEVIYDFRLKNNLVNFMNQKYRDLDEIRTQFPMIEEAHVDGKFPKEIIDRLRNILDEMGNAPLIVRSSSLLEDNFGYSFAGKYSSYFCPNQGTPEENLTDLLDAVRKVYASTLNPDAILYRRHHGLIDYDERMAVLLQRLEGKVNGRYFFPTLAGVGFSQNPFRWNRKIRREDGFMRLVWGMGTRAVDRVANDYPRMIALSHPQLRPETTAKDIRQYSQWFIDVIDLEDNEFKTIPIQEILTFDYPDLRYIVSLDKGDYLQRILSVGSLDHDDKFILTFDHLTKDRNFVKLMRTALRRLEEVYNTPVDIEYAINIIPKYPYPEYQLKMLQCRPLSQRKEEGQITIPKTVSTKDTLFRTKGLIPDGKVEGIRYIVFIDPRKYRMIPNSVEKLEVGRVVSRLNKRLEDEQFILMGPGRWGSANLELGVRVTYADIYNTRALIEMAVAQEGVTPELSYGTHFFQDLVESQIYALPIHLQEKGAVFNWEYFENAANCLSKLLPEDKKLAPYVHVIDIAQVSGINRRVNIYMDGNQDEALGFLVTGDWKIIEKKATVSNF
ncbi:MAG: phosphoenolpyruvate synthase [Chloroflexi bacterium]|nr:MAG: phosphoenolpyruvate synthase [Chloroflexota bacterium]